MSFFSHEIACPNNKGIMNYLWFNYFHDSHIIQIDFDRLEYEVALTLDSTIDNDPYLLHFKGVKYFHQERLNSSNDYLNGQFLQTALLMKLQKDSRKNLYHFRINISDGYLDIIFSGFSIRKQSGRVKYPIKEIPGPYDVLTSWNLPGIDYERAMHLHSIVKQSDPNIVNEARKHLHLEDDCEMSCLYSAYLLGKSGDSSDMNKLFDLYLKLEEYYVSQSICRCSALEPKRVIMDAIELIEYREQQK